MVDSTFSLPPGLPANPSLLATLLDLLPMGVIYYTPVVDTAGTLTDLALAYLNPVAQRLTQLPAQPGTTYRQQFPTADANGAWNFHHRSWLGQEPQQFQFYYGADGLDGYFRVTTQRLGEGLLAVFTDTQDEALSGMENALRDSQVREQARAQQAQELQTELLVVTKQRAVEREAFYQVFEQTTALVALLRGAAHRYEYVNPAYQALFVGRPLVGRAVAEAVPELVTQGFEALLDNVYQTGETFVGAELRFTADPLPGQAPRLRYFNFTFQAYREAGQVLGVTIFAFDVTAQVLARQELERQQQLTNTVFEQAPIPLFVATGPALVLEVVNTPLATLFNQPRERLLGRPHAEAFPELVRQGFSELLREVWQSGQARTFTAMPVQLPNRPAGELGYYNFVYQPLLDAQGQVYGVAGVGSDVTDQVRNRQQVEQLNAELETRVQARTRELREQQTLLSQILAQMPAATATLSGPEHRFTFTNEQYQRLTSHRAAHGVPVAVALPETSEQGFIALLDQVYRTGAPYVGRETLIWLTQSDGQPSQHYLDFSYQPLFDEQHTPQGILVFAVDVTERVQSRKQAETLQAAVLAAVHRQAQQRQDLYNIFEQAPTAIVLLREPDHRIDYFNPTFTAVFPPEEWSGSLRGHPIEEVYPHLRIAGLLDLLDSVYSTGEGQVLTEMPLAQLQPGSPRYITLAYQAYREQGRIAGVAAFAYDVTEQVVARQRLSQQQEDNEQQLRRIFAQAPVALGLFQGPESRLELANAAMSKLLGRPLEQIAGQPVFEAMPELRDQGFESLLADVRVNGTPYQLQEVPVVIDRAHTGLPPTGYFNISYQPYRDGAGTILGALALGMEVTDQVLARQQAEQAAQRLRLLTDALPVLIGYLDRDHVYRFTNEAYRTWFGQDPTALLGRHVREVVGEQAYQVALPRIQQALAGQRVDFEASMPYRQDFSKRIRTSYIPDVQAGEVVGFYTLVTDVTQEVEARERVQDLNKALQATNARLLRTNADLDTFVYTASHDLKSPITNIEGLLTVLRERLPASTQLDPTVPYVLGLIEGAVTRFQSTLHHLTDISRLQNEQEQPAEAIDLPALVEEVRLDILPELTAASATLEVNLAHCSTVHFAPKHLRSIIYNLLSNAVKYRAADRPPLVQLRCQGSASGELLLEVQDNGLGLSPQQQQELFQMFRRLHTHVPGSGVGLYMVKRILENVGGRIEVSSELGQGTTFRVYFQS